MINRSVLVGRLTRDPELRKTQTGKLVVSFTLAVNRKFSKEEQADFINCVAWNQTADFMANYLTKGTLVSVEGSIQSRTYEDKGGNTVFVQEVVANSVQALESRLQRENTDAGYQPNVTPSFSQKEEPVLDIDNSDLPF